MDWRDYKKTDVVCPVCGSIYSVEMTPLKKGKSNEV